MRRSGIPSPTAAAMRLIARGVRAGVFGGRDGANEFRDVPVSPRRRLSVERGGIRADPSRVAAYLRATGAGGFAAATKPGSPLPPLYPAVWETALALELLGAGDLPFPRGGLLHLGGETVQVRPLQVDEPVLCRAELQGLESSEGGTRLTVRYRNWDQKGRLCSEDTVLLLARTGRAGNGAKAHGTAGERPRKEAEWELLADWRLGASHGRQYARASGDYNPIHLWAVTARPFGYRRPILQGFCTQAMVAHALVERRLDGDISRLRRLEISFRAPVDLPSSATLMISPAEGGGRFRVIVEGAARPAAEGGWVGQG